MASGLAAESRILVRRIVLREHLVAFVQKFLHVVEAFVQLFLEALEDQRRKSVRDIFAEKFRSRRRFLHVLERNFHRAAAFERQTSASHFVKDHAHAVNVGLERDFISVALFGRHVFGRTHRHAGAGEAFLFHLLDVRNAKIHDVDAVVAREHDVRGLHVAVDDALAVRVKETACNLLDDDFNRFERKLALVLQNFGERNTLHVSHRDKELLALLTKVEHVNDVLVVEFLHGLCFEVKALDGLFVGGRVENLEGYFAV